MSLDKAGPNEPATTVEAVPADDAGGGRRISMWVLVVPIALAIAAAALAFFILAPRDDDLMATTDGTAEAVAVANARPAPPAFEPPESAQAPPAAPIAAAPTQ